LKLHPGRIDLWCTFFDGIRDDLLGQYRELLTDGERRQEARFHFAADRRRYLVTRALVRTTLSRYVPVAPEQWSFSANAYGRPEITNDDQTARTLSFNVSHTKSLIVLGVTCNSALGVDTENVRIREAALDVADRFFSPAEVAALNALPADMRHDRFFDYWTLKESYIKARGMGLSIPLDQFGFHFPDERRVDISMSSRLNDSASRWRFWQLRPSADYLVALCVERSGQSSPEVQTRSVIPFDGDESIDCPILRRSD
jgi:4'-phosphopantetheinyl transferase